MASASLSTPLSGSINLLTSTIAARPSDRPQPLADPQPVVHRQRLVLRQVVLEVRPDPAVSPLALPGLLRVVRVVQVHARVPLPADYEAHGRPRPVLRALLRLRIPVHLLAHLAL